MKNSVLNGSSMYLFNDEKKFTFDLKCDLTFCDTVYTPKTIQY